MRAPFRIALALTSFLAAPVSAQQIGVARLDAASEQRYSEAGGVFQVGCVDAAPNYSAALASFKSWGYFRQTDDPAVFERPGHGFAGLGVYSESGARNREFNGCLVYVRGLDGERAAAGADEAIKQRFNKVQASKDGLDFYWRINDLSPKIFLGIVSPKTEGKYAGHTLFMIVDVTQ